MPRSYLKLVQIEYNLVEKMYHTSLWDTLTTDYCWCCPRVENASLGMQVFMTVLPAQRTIIGTDNCEVMDNQYKQRPLKINDVNYRFMRASSGRRFNENLKAELRWARSGSCR